MIGIHNDIIDLSTIEKTYMSRIEIRFMVSRIRHSNFCNENIFISKHLGGCISGYIFYSSIFSL